MDEDDDSGNEGDNRSDNNSTSQGGEPEPSDSEYPAAAS